MIAWSSAAWPPAWRVDPAKKRTHLLGGKPDEVSGAPAHAQEPARDAVQAATVENEGLPRAGQAGPVTPAPAEDAPSDVLGRLARLEREVSELRAALSRER